MVCCGESDCTGIDMALRKSEKKAIGKFLRTHYKYGDESGQKIKADEVYSFYKQLKPDNQCSFSQFHSRAQAIGVKVKKDSERKTYYYTTPLTDISCTHHGAGASEDSEGKGYVTLNLVNIRGLITSEHNKIETIDKFANLKGGSGKILVMTETHLIKGEHMKQEVVKYLPGYSLARSDRDTSFDEESLDKCGGTLISASSDIINKEVEEFRYSNGNCELTTVEMVQMEIAVLALYRPSGRNFSLAKFKDVMDKARAYLTELRANKPRYKVIFCGDFNFPEEIVKWVNTEDGLIADPIAGTDRRKLA